MCLVVLMLCCRAGSNMRVCHFAAQIPLQWQCGRCRALVLGRMPGGETLLLKWLELPDMCVATCGFATWLVLGSVQDRAKHSVLLCKVVGAGDEGQFVDRGR